MRIILSSNPYRDRGLRTALEADRILRKAGAETVLCLPFVPKKGERLELPRQAALHKLEEELPKADLLVCASFAEGYSTVCVEANMLGIPVLSTCVDGAKEIVDDAGAGMVVGMDDDSLCDGLRKVLREPELVAEWKKTVETTRQVFSYRNRAAELDQLDF